MRLRRLTLVIAGLVAAWIAGAFAASIVVPVGEMDEERGNSNVPRATLLTTDDEWPDGASPLVT